MKVSAEYMEQVRRDLHYPEALSLPRLLAHLFSVIAFHFDTLPPEARDEIGAAMKAVRARWSETMGVTL